MHKTREVNISVHKFSILTDVFAVYFSSSRYVSEYYVKLGHDRNLPRYPNFIIH
jgi:hypothetical protein